MLQQRLSQLDGIGEVDVVGSALPAVRVELNPGALFKYGIGLEDVRAALAAANANSPKGAIEDDDFHYQIYANDQATKADQYRDLVVAYRNNAAVKLTDVAEVVDSVEDLRNAGLSNGKPSVAIVLSRQPGANIIQAVDGVKAELPRLAASLPGDVDLNVVVDRSITIRGSLADTERTLDHVGRAGDPRRLRLPAQCARRRRFRASPCRCRSSARSRAMYLLGLQPRQSVADGADDLDRLRRRRRDRRAGEHHAGTSKLGETRLQAAILGAREVGFTVLSISLSLIAVFLPLLLMGGIVGRLFREFAMTLSMAVLISLVVSLTTTPMMCALILPRQADRDARPALSHDRARLRRDARLLSPSRSAWRCAIR